MAAHSTSHITDFTNTLASLHAVEWDWPSQLQEVWSTALAQSISRNHPGPSLNPYMLVL